MDEKQAFNELIRTDPYFGQLINWCFPQEATELAGKIIADIGCGSGLMSVFLALQGATVIGIDIADEELQKARQRACELGVGHLCQFIQASAEALSLPDGVVDMVFSRSSLQYIDRQRALPEYLRILRTGSSLILLENLPYSPLINLFRFKRWLLPASTNEAQYRRTIKQYVRFNELHQLSQSFTSTQQRYLHLSRVMWVFMKTSPRMAGRWPELAFGRLTNQVDLWLFKYLPPMRRLA